MWRFNEDDSSNMYEEPLPQDISSLSKIQCIKYIED